MAVRGKSITSTVFVTTAISITETVSTKIPPPIFSGSSARATQIPDEEINQPETLPQLQGQLSTGAKAGMGVGIASLGAIAITAIALLFQERRKRKTVEAIISQQPYMLDPRKYVPQELDARGFSTSAPVLAVPIELSAEQGRHVPQCRGADFANGRRWI